METSKQLFSLLGKRCEPKNHSFILEVRIINPKDNIYPGKPFLYYDCDFGVHIHERPYSYIGDTNNLPVEFGTTILDNKRTVYSIPNR